ncbi:MAG: hypothetical protein HYX27_02690 [Acidobacteria bacterium]|nr:hypothetical protein [Acidobacteriota bacterium]
MNNKLPILLAAATLSLTAQSANKVSANIWFPFEVNGVSLPAGNYHVSRSENPKLITISNPKTSKRIMVLATPAAYDKYGPAKLTFDVIGTRYFLKSVTERASGMVHEVPQSRRSKELISAAKPEVVVLAAR